MISLRDTYKKISEEKVDNFMKRWFPTGFTYELVTVFKFSWPMVTTTVFNILIRTLPVIFSGHLGITILDGVSMAVSIANLVGTSIAVGFIGACNTLFSQSYGSGNKKQLGIYLQTAFYLASLICFLCWGLLLNINNILLALGQNVLIAKYTEDYLFVFMPGIFFIFTYLLLVRYLLVQGIALPSVLVGFLTNLVSAALQYLLIYTADLGLRGSALALLCGYFMLCSMLVGYIYFSGVYKPTWGGWSREALVGWGEFTKLGLSSILMTCAEWWTLELSFFLMGLIGAVELGANSIMYQIWMLYYAVSIGLSSASALQIGYYLGANNVAGAITATRVVLCVAATLSLTSALLTLALRSYLPLMFTSDPSVVDMAQYMLLFLIPFSFFGTAKNVLAGIVQGIGEQVFGGIATVFAYVVCALPLGISLMFFTSVRGSGLWLGINAGMAITCLFFLTFVLTTNWERAVEKAQIRAKTVKRSTDNTEAACDTTVEEGPMSSKYGSLFESNHTHTEVNWRNLALFRAAISLACFACLVFGIVSRFVIFIPPIISHVDNSTFFAQ